ncbi:MAG: AbiTii domain-containing protein, partial [Erysipelotrichaceae bacterium]
MAKSKIIIELVNNETDLSIALNKFLVIVSELGNENLEKWIKCELKGYKDIDELPDYRKNLPYTIVYSGIVGSFQVTRQPLPIHSFGKYAERISQMNSINNSIMELINIEGKNMLIDLTKYQTIVYQNTDIQCISISFELGKNVKDIIIT